jgi:hypothetical protein
MQTLLMYVLAASLTTSAATSINPNSTVINPGTSTTVERKKPKLEAKVTNDVVIVTDDGSTVTLRSGTPVVVEAMQTYSSKNLSEGQTVSVRVKFNVVVNKKTVVAAGALGNATITDVQKAGGFGKPGRLELQIQSVQSVDGQQILVSGMNMISEGQNKRGLAWGLSIGLFLLTIIGGAIGFFIKGKPAELKAGTTSNTSVASDAQIDVDEQ